MTTTRTRARRNGRLREAPAPPATVRVAIYTRKSVDEGSEQEFGSLEAQREAVEAYVTSQQSEGWMALPERYDDMGFSGSNTDRPAFQRLLRDIEAGLVDVVAVYKIDRLSRSLLDFSRLMETFQKHGVTFVSVTQQFNTTTSVGRMTLNLLATFAQFERETIAERTRDKIAAQRRRGMWTGGRPVLGYDVRAKKLVVNKREAEQVREIFLLYLKHGTLLATVEELHEHGFHTKSWTTMKGRRNAGHPFHKGSLHSHLTNPTYIGKMRLADELHSGQHEAIVDQETWDAVQHQLRAHGTRGGSRHHARGGALLSGLLQCGQCGASMTSSYSSRGPKRYGYYACATAQKRGARACPGSRAPAGEMDLFVVERIRQVGKDPTLVRATIEAARNAQKERTPELVAEVRRLGQQRRRLGEERKNLLDAVAHGGSGVAALTQRLGEVDGEAEVTAQRAQEVRAELVALESGSIDEDELRAALAEFDPVWDQLLLKEQARILRLLLEQVTFHAGNEEVNLRFRPGGVKQLASERRREA